MAEKNNGAKLSREDAKKLVHEETKELMHEEKKEIPHEQHKEISHDKTLELKPESRKDLESDLIRLQAEFENYKKRSEKEKSEMLEMGKMEFGKSQISVLDEFENAIAHLKGEEQKGIQMLLSNFRKSLSLHGVKEMECIGHKYDPYKHDVLMQQESDKPEGTIVSVVRKGYMFKDKVLRHAQVIIAKKQAGKTDGGSQSQVSGSDKKGE